MEWYEILSILGIGAIISTLISVLMDVKNKKAMLREENLILMKIERYRSLLVFMNLVIKPEDIEFCISDKGDPLLGYKDKDYESIKNNNYEKVKGYYYHLFLFASEKVIDNVKEFINEPNKEKFINTAKAMRKDVWNIKL